MKSETDDVDVDVDVTIDANDVAVDVEIDVDGECDGVDDGEEGADEVESSDDCDNVSVGGAIRFVPNWVSWFPAKISVSRFEHVPSARGKTVSLLELRSSQVSE